MIDNDGGSGKISIHSLRVEGDEGIDSLSGNSDYFNPLPPCGGRLVGFSGRCPAVQFQSTPSVWRETGNIDVIVNSNRISIHSLRVEGDARCGRLRQRQSQFQSTPSVWRETLAFAAIRMAIKISIHSLRVEGDQMRREAGVD